MLQRRILVRAGVALTAVLLFTTACGAASTGAHPAGATSSPAAAGATATAATTPGGTPSARGPRAGFRQNPAIAAATEIILVAPVVPFNPTQVKQLVPILQALAKDPTMPATELAAKAKQITGALTKVQVEAIANLRKSHLTGGGFGGTTGARRPPRRPSGAAGARGHFKFNPATIYNRAIAVLQGKATGGFSFGGQASPQGGGTTTPTA